MIDRSRALQSVRDREFDVCIIGGGATGAGSALDAQLRGKSTVLLDQADFFSQTSSASTKLAHGGVRYLQQAVASFDYGQFTMVRKALHERIHMLRIAPYLARPLELLVPCHSRFEMVYFGIGMKLYDAISGRDKLQPSHVLLRDQALRRLPALRREGMVGAVSYTDGQFDDARYGMALVKTFAREGGEVLNYARVVGFGRGENGRLATAEVEDRISGGRFTIRARVFVNCTGPFADHIRLMANPAVPRRLRVSKGIHILLPVDAMQSDAALLIPKTEDGRVIFAIPWLGSLLVGTTEDEIDLGQEIVATADEIAYLLRYINRYLNTSFTDADVRAAFAGVRPLVAVEGGSNTAELIRDHQVEVDESSGLVSILGGKWTTYRLMAEDGINHALRVLGDRSSPSRTLDFPLAGTSGFSSRYVGELAAKYALSPRTAEHLVQKFGTDATQVLELTAAEPALLEPLYAGASAIAAEVIYCAREEMAQSMEDVLARRVGIQFHSWKDAVAAAPMVGRLLGRELGWSEQQRAQAIADYISYVRHLASCAGLQPPAEKNVVTATDPILRG